MGLIWQLLLTMRLVHRMSATADKRKPVPVTEVSLNFTSGCQSSYVRVLTLPAPLASPCSTAATLMSQSTSGATANSFGVLPTVSSLVYFLV